MLCDGFVCRCVSSSCWAAGTLPGSSASLACRALTVRSGFPLTPPPPPPLPSNGTTAGHLPSPLLPRHHIRPPPSSPGRLPRRRHSLGRKGEKMGAARLCSPHRLTEMLNLLLSSLSLVTLVHWFLWRSRVRLTSITRPLIRSTQSHSPGVPRAALFWGSFMNTTEQRVNLCRSEMHLSATAVSFLRREWRRFCSLGNASLSRP